MLWNYENKIVSVIGSLRTNATVAYDEKIFFSFSDDVYSSIKRYRVSSSANSCLMNSEAPRIVWY
jgi:hypothetical protein